MVQTNYRVGIQSVTTLPASNGVILVRKLVGSFGQIYRANIGRTRVCRPGIAHPAACSKIIRERRQGLQHEFLPRGSFVRKDAAPASRVPVVVVGLQLPSEVRRTGRSGTRYVLLK